MERKGGRLESEGLLNRRDCAGWEIIGEKGTLLITLDINIFVVS